MLAACSASPLPLSPHPVARASQGACSPPPRHSFLLISPCAPTTRHRSSGKAPQPSLPSPSPPLPPSADLLKASRNLSFFTSFYRFLIQVLPAAVVAPLYFRGEIEFGVINQSASGERQGVRAGLPRSALLLGTACRLAGCSRSSGRLCFLLVCTESPSLSPIFHCCSQSIPTPTCKNSHSFALAAFNHILTDVSLVVYQFEAIAGFSGGHNTWAALALLLALDGHDSYRCFCQG